MNIENHDADLFDDNNDADYLDVELSSDSEPEVETLASDSEEEMEENSLSIDLDFPMRTICKELNV